METSMCSKMELLDDSEEWLNIPPVIQRAMRGLADRVDLVAADNTTLRSKLRKVRDSVPAVIAAALAHRDNSFPTASSTQRSGGHPKRSSTPGAVDRRSSNAVASPYSPGVSAGGFFTAADGAGVPEAAAAPMASFDPTLLIRMIENVSAIAESAQETAANASHSLSVVDDRLSAVEERCLSSSSSVARDIDALKTVANDLAVQCHKVDAVQTETSLQLERLEKEIKAQIAAVAVAQTKLSSNYGGSNAALHRGVEHQHQASASYDDDAIGATLESDVQSHHRRDHSLDRSEGGPRQELSDRLNDRLSAALDHRLGERIKAFDSQRRAEMERETDALKASLNDRIVEMIIGETDPVKAAVADAIEKAKNAVMTALEARSNASKALDIAGAAKSESEACIDQVSAMSDAVAHSDERIRQVDEHLDGQVSEIREMSRTAGSLQTELSDLKSGVNRDLTTLRRHTERQKEQLERCSANTNRLSTIMSQHQKETADSVEEAMRAVSEVKETLSASPPATIDVVEESVSNAARRLERQFESAHATQAAEFSKQLSDVSRRIIDIERESTDNAQQLIDVRSRTENADRNSQKSDRDLESLKDTTSRAVRALQHAVTVLKDETHAKVDRIRGSVESNAAITEGNIDAAMERAAAIAQKIARKCTDDIRTQIMRDVDTAVERTRRAASAHADDAAAVMSTIRDRTNIIAARTDAAERCITDLQRELSAPRSQSQAESRAQSQRSRSRGLSEPRGSSPNPSGLDRRHVSTGLYTLPSSPSGADHHPRADGAGASVHRSVEGRVAVSVERIEREVSNAKDEARLIADEARAARDDARTIARRLDSLERQLGDQRAAFERRLAFVQDSQHSVSNRDRSPSGTPPTNIGRSVGPDECASIAEEAAERICQEQLRMQDEALHEALVAIRRTVESGQHRHHERADQPDPSPSPSMPRESQQTSTPRDSGGRPIVPQFASPVRSVGSGVAASPRTDQRLADHTATGHFSSVASTPRSVAAAPLTATSDVIVDLYARLDALDTESVTHHDRHADSRRTMENCVKDILSLRDVLAAVTQSHDRLANDVRDISIQHDSPARKSVSFNRSGERQKSTDADASPARYHRSPMASANANPELSAELLETWPETVRAAVDVAKQADRVAGLVSEVDAAREAALGLLSQLQEMDLVRSRFEEWAIQRDLSHMWRDGGRGRDAGRDSRGGDDHDEHSSVRRAGSGSTPRGGHSPSPPRSSRGRQRSAAGVGLSPRRFVDDGEIDVSPIGRGQREDSRGRFVDLGAAHVEHDDADAYDSAPRTRRGRGGLGGSSRRPQRFFEEDDDEVDALHANHPRDSGRSGGVIATVEQETQWSGEENDFPLTSVTPQRDRRANDSAVAQQNESTAAYGGVPRTRVVRRPTRTRNDIDEDDDANSDAEIDSRRARALQQSDPISSDDAARILQQHVVRDPSVLFELSQRIAPPVNRVLVPDAASLCLRAFTAAAERLSSTQQSAGTSLTTVPPAGAAMLPPRVHALGVDGRAAEVHSQRTSSARIPRRVTTPRQEKQRMNEPPVGLQTRARTPPVPRDMHVDTATCQMALDGTSLIPESVTDAAMAAVVTAVKAALLADRDVMATIANSVRQQSVGSAFPTTDQNPASVPAAPVAPSPPRGRDGPFVSVGDHHSPHLVSASEGRTDEGSPSPDRFERILQRLSSIEAALATSTSNDGAAAVAPVSHVDAVGAHEGRAHSSERHHMEALERRVQALSDRWDSAVSSLRLDFTQGLIDTEARWDPRVRAMVEQHVSGSSIRRIVADEIESDQTHRSFKRVADESTRAQVMAAMESPPTAAFERAMSSVAQEHIEAFTRSSLPAKIQDVIRAQSSKESPGPLGLISVGESERLIAEELRKVMLTVDAKLFDAETAHGEIAATVRSLSQRSAAEVNALRRALTELRQDVAEQVAASSTAFDATRRIEPSRVHQQSDSPLMFDVTAAVKALQATTVELGVKVRASEASTAAMQAAVDGMQAGIDATVSEQIDTRVAAAVNAAVALSAAARRSEWTPERPSIHPSPSTQASPDAAASPQAGQSPGQGPSDQRKAEAYVKKAMRRHETWTKELVTTVATDLQAQWSADLKEHTASLDALIDRVRRSGGGVGGDGHSPRGLGQQQQQQLRSPSRFTTAIDTAGAASGSNVRERLAAAATGLVPTGAPATGASTTAGSTASTTLLEEFQNSAIDVSVHPESSARFDELSRDVRGLTVRLRDLGRQVLDLRQLQLQHPGGRQGVSPLQPETPTDSQKGPNQREATTSLAPEAEVGPAVEVRITAAMDSLKAAINDEFTRALQSAYDGAVEDAVSKATEAFDAKLSDFTQTLDRERPVEERQGSVTELSERVGSFEGVLAQFADALQSVSVEVNGIRSSFEKRGQSSAPSPSEPSISALHEATVTNAAAVASVQHELAQQQSRVEELTGAFEAFRKDSEVTRLQLTENTSNVGSLTQRLATFESTTSDARLRGVVNSILQESQASSSPLKRSQHDLSPSTIEQLRAEITEKVLSDVTATVETKIDEDYMAIAAQIATKATLDRVAIAMAAAKDEITNDLSTMYDRELTTLGESVGQCVSQETLQQEVSAVTAAFRSETSALVERVDRIAAHQASAATVEASGVNEANLRAIRERLTQLEERVRGCIDHDALRAALEIAPVTHVATEAIVRPPPPSW